MNRSEEKAQRLLQIEKLLWAHPEGLTRAELARRLEVNRSTITKYLDAGQLPPGIYEEEDGSHKLKMDKDADLTRASFSLHEVMAIHLATRLLATRTDKQNPHAASALRKLGIALQRLDHNVSDHLLRSANVMDENASFHDPVYLKVLETLTEAWSAGRKVHLSHQMENGRIYEYKFAPFFIEPYAVGQTTHVIGWREPPGAQRTFKIERIRAVQILSDRYEIPADFDPAVLLRDAWGIWYSDAAPVEVTLRFHPRVALRVKETRWQSSQQIEEASDGYLLWRARVAEPQEMVPWIRGWGADVEVVGPEELRQALSREARKLAEMYGVRVAKTEDELIAHWRKRDQEAQSLRTHLLQTSQLAERFASKVGLPEVGRMLGLLHDLGKASTEYQNYLRTNEGLISPDEDGYSQARRGEIDHSTAGAQLIYRRLANRGQEGRFLAQFSALALASHHSGLIDCLTPDGKNNFQRRMDKADEDTHFTEAMGKLPDIAQQLDEILAQPVEQRFYKKLYEELKETGDSKETLAFKRGLLARFLLSCLLDADRLNTADFETPENELMRNYGRYHLWPMLIERLERKLVEFDRVTAQMDKANRAYEVNKLRVQVAQACLDAAAKPKGIYQLTVPTGGGKTLASLRFALHHALAHKLDRIFYIVPYITIIDQNANKVRETLEKMDEIDKVVLEHHSNLTPEMETRRHNLLAENWDAPVIFTTQVQFLESLFGGGTRDARRMHQLASSVIILDEVQTVPIKMTHMFNTAMRFLVHDCGATVLLCTATQPPFEDTGNNYRSLSIPRENHIIQNEQGLFERLKRVEVHDERKPGGWTWEEMADLTECALRERGSVLAVMNTRASARALYQEIKNRNLAETYHLSTNMCPAHRLDVLEKKVKVRLEANEPVICVSTQLIEAGVDIDFGAVIRALAGLDSIAQSAGRCNRHGVREGLGSVWVINPQEENLDRLPDIKTGREKVQTVLDDFRVDAERFDGDRIGLQAIAEYYRYYFKVKEKDMDYPVDRNSRVGQDDDLYDVLSSNRIALGEYLRIHQAQAAPDMLLRQSFQSAGKEFQVIDSVTHGVIVPYKDGEMVIAELCSARELDKQYKLLKKAQRYSVNLFIHDFDKLCGLGAIQEVQPEAGIYYLNEQYYSEEFGWSHEPVSDMKISIA